VPCQRLALPRPCALPAAAYASLLFTTRRAQSTQSESLLSLRLLLLLLLRDRDLLVVFFRAGLLLRDGDLELPLPPFFFFAM